MSYNGTTAASGAANPIVPHGSIYTEGAVQHPSAEQAGFLALQPCFIVPVGFEAGEIPLQELSEKIKTAKDCRCGQCMGCASVKSAGHSSSSRNDQPDATTQVDNTNPGTNTLVNGYHSQSNSIHNGDEQINSYTSVQGDRPPPFEVGEDVRNAFLPKQDLPKGERLNGVDNYASLLEISSLGSAHSAVGSYLERQRSAPDTLAMCSRSGFSSVNGREVNSSRSVLGDVNFLQEFSFVWHQIGIIEKILLGFSISCIIASIVITFALLKHVPNGRKKVAKQIFFGGALSVMVSSGIAMTAARKGCAEILFTLTVVTVMGIFFNSFLDDVLT